MNACEGCGLPLPPGAAHVNESSCILALRAELDRLRNCAGCGRVMKVAVCPPCAAKGLAKGAASQGVTALGTAFWRWLNEARTAGDDDLPTAPGGGEGKRFRP
jgi:hypothetical protein